jgi:DNA polymerase-4
LNRPHLGRDDWKFADWSGLKDLRKIIHIDMDAFYASVEQRDRPELRGRPVAVGGTSRRGVVAAASYEARAFGVRSAMPSVVARRLCPDLVFVKTRFDVYRGVSAEIRDVFRSYTDLVEPLSLDEAYLYVTAPRKGPASATLIAREIKRTIQARTGLTASAGVSFNKFLAKIASDYDKPDGLTVILPEEASAFIAALPVEKFFGVGPVTARKMHGLGIHYGRDLMDRGEDELVALFGKTGRYYFRTVRCEDDRPVRVNRVRKSVGAERTFAKNISTLDEMSRRLRDIAGHVGERMLHAGVTGRTVTLKIKYHDFDITTRQRSSTRLVCEEDVIYEIADGLLKRAPEPPTRPVRLLGISVSNLTPHSSGGIGGQMEFDFKPPDP